MKTSITTKKDEMVVTVFDAEAARVTLASAIFPARIQEEIVPLARIVEQQLRIERARTLKGDVSYAGDPGRAR